MTGIDIKERAEYSSELDRANPKMVFVFKPMTNSQKIRLAPRTEGQYQTPENIFTLLKTCLAEIKNYDGDKSLTEISDETLDNPRLDFFVLMDVVNEIVKVNFLSENERKN